MKKLLLALSAVALSASVTSAQTLTLYEEFSGENCAPCAAANPGLWTLLSANPSKVMLIKYQSPIPSAGPIYNAYKTITNARLSYYSVPFAPYGRLQGTILGTGTAAPSSPGHVANLTQADINTAAAATPPFNMTVTHAWNATGDSVTANVSITAPAAFAPAGANLKLRIAIIEHLTYATPPGTNGETDFHNVVREMVPDAGGTSILNSWTAAQTQNYTVKGKVTNILDKNNSECILVVWIQNETDKSIYQTVKSNHISIALDAGATLITPATKFACASGATANVTSTATIKNTGTTTLTSAKVYYRADNGTYGATPVSWTGSLAPGGTATVAIPAVSLSAGSRMIVDSIALPNGSTDINGGNNVAQAAVSVQDVSGATLPLSTNFESGFPTGWNNYDFPGNSKVWVNGYGDKLAHNASSYMPWYKINTTSSGYPAGSFGYLVMPTPKIAGPVAIDFWQAYAQKSASNNDKLEIVYSTNCGTSWTSLWALGGTALATTAPTSTYWLPSPTAGSTDWKQRSVSLSSLPANAILAFKATADGGNNLFIDDVNIRAGAVGVPNVVEQNSLNVYPNPAREAATLEFSLSSSTQTNVSILDATGRTVAVVADGVLQQGKQKFNLPTNNLASGLYNIVIRTEGSSLTQRLSVVK